ncbi:MAG: type I restriction endonuclease subunit R [Pirellulaceae bacterium]
MKSANFELLRPKWPELAGLGGFAEAYAHTDPIGAMGKLRTFCEHMAKSVRHELRLPTLFRPTLIDLLDDAAFQSAVPDVIVSKMHALRIEGNRAVHGNEGDTAVVLRLLRDAYDLARWLFVTFADGRVAACPAFVEPPEGGVEAVERRREKKAILERVAAQEAQMQRLLDELDAARAQAEQAHATATELEAALAAGQQSVKALKAVSPLDYDEAATRRYLIDTMLADAGWNVGPDLVSTDEVGKEVEVQDQPTESGIGYADYVLWDDDGKPLAVIEAKKTARNAEDGRTQAKCYADGLEKEHCQRPVIYYTNGYDLWIWNDAEAEPPRKTYGYYSKDSLQRLHFQRKEKQPLSAIAPNPAIASRMYQIEAIRRMVERFATKKRKGLIVQATGTGKTRVAVSLSDALIRANWAKRILFLCDRRELRKQAHNVFKEFLPGETRVFVTAHTAGDREKRIYLATYPAMMKCYESFDVGFFDLIIADESHRSLYNRYRQIFEYFDAYQVGLTATPLNEDTRKTFYRNTFRLFGCDDLNPTANYDYIEAINARPPYLVPFVVDTHTTAFLRTGIKYTQMTDEQKRQLEEDEEAPEAIEHELAEVDKVIFNKDTNRHIIRNLMESGIRNADGSHVGKTIIFARNHNHAVLLQNVFDEMYPQFGGNFCRVIDHYDPRAEELIDDFKGEGTNPDLTIAISVDMLDTGIDVPEIVNLVFAKPVYSFVKFWQMIGRGTRLRQNLFGLGKDKTHFQIFDHWGNFERFDQGYTSAEPTRVKSLMQQVFESRLRLADAALEKQKSEAFELAIELIGEDIASLPDKTVAVREKWQHVRTVGREQVLQRFDAATRATLENEIAPLMQWVNITGHEAAHTFDRLIAQLQRELLRGSSRFDDLKDDLLNQISSLPINLSQVKVKLPVIERVKSPEFWDNVSVRDLEEVRCELRGIVQFRPKATPPASPPKVIDVTEEVALIERKRHKVKLEGLDMVAYRNRVHKVLMDLFEDSEILQKIKAGQPVDEGDLESLCSLVLTQDPNLDLHDLADYFPETIGHLDQAIRSIIGMDAEAVHRRFTQFVQEHPNLASHQIRFLDMLQNHIAKYGSIEIDRLYEPPFTLIHMNGLDGVFGDDTLAEELLAIVDSFKIQAS